MSLKETVWLRRVEVCPVNRSPMNHEGLYNFNLAGFRSVAMMVVN